MPQNQNDIEYEPLPILIIEDDEVDLMSIQRALKDLKIANPTIHAKDGAEALNYLYGTDGYEKINSTDLIILLDLNMPRITGLEFLEKLRADDAFASSKIFVLTTSEADSDIVGTYKKSIAGYILKSHLRESLAKKLWSLQGEYWGVIVRPR